MKLPEFSERTDEWLCAIGSISGICATITIAATLDMRAQLVAYILVLFSSVIVALWSMSVRNKWFLAMELMYFSLGVIGVYTRYTAIGG